MKKTFVQQLENVCNNACKELEEELNVIKTKKDE